MNAVLRRLAPTHPAFFRFIDCIRMHEFSKSIELSEIIRWGNVRSRKQTKADKLDVMVKQLTYNLEVDPEMDSGVFLRQLASEHILPDAGKIMYLIPLLTCLSE